MKTAPAPALPQALHPWQPWLRWFQPMLAAELGELLIRLNPLLGRWQGHRQAGQPEPDGLDDLRRRGSYERLLSSEWLLASELPDEFLRRAASGEHLFLTPRPRARQADRMIVAVFDAGPWQLGAARLAHIALWILLARRAAEAGGVMRWGLLSQPGQWHGADSADDLKRLLGARSFEAAPATSWHSWASWLDEQADAGIGERWVIGHTLDACRQGPASASHGVQLRHSLAGDALEVMLRAGTTGRSMRLPLPPQRAALLLQGRFDADAPARIHRYRSERLSMQSGAVISASGHLVAVPLLEGAGAMVFRVPAVHSDRSPPPKRVQWGKSAEPLALAFSGKSLAGVLSHHQKLDFWQIPELGLRERPAREAFDAPPGRAGLLPMSWCRDARWIYVHLIDAAQRLVLWQAPTRRNAAATLRGPVLVAEAVLALTRITEQHLVFLAVRHTKLHVCFASRNFVESRSYELCDVEGPNTRVLLGGGVRWHTGFGGCAVRAALSSDIRPEAWRVYEQATDKASGYGSWDAELPPGTRAIGLVHQPKTADKPSHYALVVQAANRCDLLLQSQYGHTTLCRLPSPAERITVCASSGLIVIVTRQRELHVYTGMDHSLRLVVHSGETDESSNQPAGAAVNEPANKGIPKAESHGSH